MARVMYLDCFAGAAGDMMLGALIDAGLPVEALRSALGSLGVGHELRVTRVLRAGLSANHVEVIGEDSGAHAHTHSHGHAHEHGHSHDHNHDHNHEHSHGHTPDHSHTQDHGHGHSHTHDQPASRPHGHRSLHDIAHLVQHSALSADGKARAVSMFRRLAEAEAAIHNMPVEQVHLHEVGALDSIIDIVGAVFGMEWFGIDDVVASALNVGGGTVEMAHGMFPIPAPATLRLLTGIPVYSSGIQAELVTPTGALLVSEYSKVYGPLPAMTTERVGYGAGTRDLGKVPNVLRIVIGERSGAGIAATHPASGDVVKIECEIDDMNPQLFAPVTEQLFAAGALDAFLTPIVMKKGRPATLLTVLAPPAGKDAICRVLFRETTTIGVRFDTVQRETLDRAWVDVAVDGGLVRMKIARRGAEILNAAPEFEDCVRVAGTTGRPIKQVHAEAMRAWLESVAPARAM